MVLIFDNFYWEIDESLPGELDKNLFPGLLSILFRFSHSVSGAVSPLCLLPPVPCLFALGMVAAGIRVCNSYFRKYEFSVIIHNSLKDRFGVEF